MSWQETLGNYTQYYLNGRGDSWVFRNRQNQNIKIRFNVDGVEYIRRTQKFESFGYSVIPTVSLKGKKHRVTTDFKYLEGVQD